ncbi:MAG: PPC domain-containing protein [Microthrixaceae bacterium]
MSRNHKRFAALAVVAAVAGLLPGGGSVASAEACVSSASSLSFTDAPGDTPVVSAAPTLYQEPTLDILSTTATWNEGAQRLVLKVEVEDLRELPALGGEGEWYDVNFAVNGAAYYVRAAWSRIDQRQTFKLVADGPAPITLAALTGSFDLVDDVVTVEVPAYVVNGAGETTFQLTDGAELRGIVVDSLRSAYGAAFFVDQSTTECTLTVTNPASSPGQAASALAEVGDALLFTGTVMAGAAGQCAPSDRVGTGWLCPSKAFNVSSPAGGAALVVTLESVTPDDGTTDIDLRLGGPNGMDILSSDAGNDDSIVVELPADGSLDGTYTVAVSPYSALDAEFTVSMTLV